MTRRNLALLVAAALVLPAVADAKPKKKKGGDEPPPVGWTTTEGGKWACYVPPAWDKLGPGDRKVERQKALANMMSQWNGTKGDGVKFDARVAENVETVLFGKPELTEGVTDQNAALCQAASKDGATIAWGQWLHDLPDKLTEGDCPSPPLDYTMYDYLEVARDWQIKRDVCKGDKIVVKGSQLDYYKLSAKGPWINVLGDPAMAPASDLLCTLEGCPFGILLMRFTGETGIVTILPVGAERVFEVPEHGTVEVSINDNTWQDNEFKIEKGLQHRTAIEYSPVSKK
jgi:hypothetical protein